MSHAFSTICSKIMQSGVQLKVVQIQGTTFIMDQLHAYDAKLFLQISAGWGRSFVLGGIFQKAIDNKVLGILGKPLLNMESIMVAPDAGEPNAWLPQYKCRQITREEIKEFVEAYAQTALLAKNAGIAPCAPALCRRW
ncbi:MAG: hypothetical protein IJV14_13855 [Lachnospiraceae bacterium]|nr:hypothetical protein [Lachnospiraceae bacterium]